MGQARNTPMPSPGRLVALALASATLLISLASAEFECPIGQVWNDDLGRCAQCPVGTVKSPDEDGVEWATCESARLVCGRAEVARYGSCYQCSASQVAVDDTKCGNCPSGYKKVPYGAVSDAVCKRSSTGACRPRREVCNGKDDDCDGLIDENLGTKTCGRGICRRTVPACVNGARQYCEPGQPQVERCNGLDDDCNGYTDDLDPITCGTGGCAVTVDACLNGQSQICTPKQPVTEVCDGIDNDCDGYIDEDQGYITCGSGLCINTVPKCVNGQVQTCAPKPGTPEICDGLDNDCDGLVDEDLGTITCGVGACTNTVTKCVNGQIQACSTKAPSAEMCDGIDNNCNGVVDEGFGNFTCGIGACVNTVPRCLNGQFQTACNPKPPTAEICDGIDNNCNNQIDEGIPDLICSPCNTRVPACAGGKPNSCTNVCAEPCCEDCSNISNPVDKLKCFSACRQDCKDLQKCIEWSDAVAGKVAAVACSEAVTACGIIQPLGVASGNRQVTALQCYYAANDQCINRGTYNFLVPPAGSPCVYYSTGGGSCSAIQFQTMVQNRLRQLCSDISIGIAVSLP